jgi:hypothetical protein
MARLDALMGEGRCGSPAVVDTWKPGAYAVTPFLPDTTGRDVQPMPATRTNIAGPSGSFRGHASEGASGDPLEHRKVFQQKTVSLPWNTEGVPAEDRDVAPALALRRFRSPVPARVTVEQGRPVRVVTDRRGLAGGRIDVSAGPWRTSGNWWEDATSAPAAPAARVASRGLLAAWDRDEWDVTLVDGATYRLFTERGTRTWFVDGLFD